MAMTQDPAIHALPEFQDVRMHNEVNGLRSDRDAELTAAVADIAHTLRVSGIEPSITETPVSYTQPQPEQPPTPAVTYEQSVAQAAEKAGPVNLNEDLDEAEKLAAVHQVYEETQDPPINVEDEYTLAA